MVCSKAVLDCLLLPAFLKPIIYVTQTETLIKIIEGNMHA